MDIDLEFLKTVAKRAGEYAKQQQAVVKPQNKIVAQKGTGKYVESKSAFSEVDARCQADIMCSIGERYKGLGIIMEETSEQIESLASEMFDYRGFREDEYSVIIDPIDGTKNYLEGSPQWSVSICIAKGFEAIAGVIEYPGLGITLSCKKGEGAFINGKRIEFAPASFSEDDVIRITSADTGIQELKNAFPQYKHFKSWTVTLLSLLNDNCNLGLDLPGCKAYIGKGNSVIDIGCGLLVVKEAGGLVSDATGNDAQPFASTFVDANKEISISNMFILAPNKRYAEELLAYMREKTGFQYS